MSGIQEDFPNFTAEPKNVDDKKVNYENVAIILNNNHTKPYEDQNGIPPGKTNVTDISNVTTGKELQADFSGKKEASISQQPRPINDDESFRDNSNDSGIDHINNINTLLDAFNAKDLNGVQNVKDNELKNIDTAEISGNEGQNIIQNSVKNEDMDHELSDDEKFKALDFSDSDFPDSPEIEKSEMLIQKPVISENPLSDSEQENSSDSEKFTPFVLRKKRTKPISRVTVDLNTLPTRISTRYRKPHIENVTAKILKPTYLTEQEPLINKDILSENIRRLKVYNELKATKGSIGNEVVLKKTNENISLHKTGNGNNKTVSKANSGTKMPMGNIDASDKHQQQNKTEIENPNSKLATTNVTKITRSNSKTSTLKPFELACTRFQLEINASINKNRSVYKTPEKERSRSPELVSELKIPHDSWKRVLKPSETSTLASNSYISEATRDGRKDTTDRRKVLEDTSKKDSTDSNSVVTRSRLKDSHVQVSTSSDPAATPRRAQTLNTPKKSPTQLSKPSTAILTRNRAHQSVTTISRPQEPPKQASKSSVLEPLTQDAIYPKIVLSRLDDHQKPGSALSVSVVTRSRQKDSLKEVSTPPGAVVTQVKPSGSPKQKSTFSNSVTTRSKSQEPIKKIPNPQKTVVPSRLQKTSVRRSQQQKSRITASKSTNTTVIQRTQQESKSPKVTQMKPQNIVVVSPKTVTRSRLEKTVDTQIRPHNNAVITQRRPHTNAVVTQRRPQKTQDKHESVVTRVTRESKPQVISSGLQTPKDTRRKTQKAVITQNESQQLPPIKTSNLLKVESIKSQSKKIINNSVMEASKTNLRSRSCRQTAVSNIIDSARSRSSHRLKRCLQCSDASSSKRTRLATKTTPRCG
ncbi:unnamed protein product [Spodoptera exigua]|uniref:Uncharacterized protein n=1 Tax=Spodoptera exigua TaxID=7107 RepID=A0A922SQN2_SPOEX|nr:hypothetical protein HF086_005609 [Spodoptera exigua]CAH0686397.1 unnamed protein product [Spodoptera exigua]